MNLKAALLVSWTFATAAQASTIIGSLPGGMQVSATATTTTPSVQASDNNHAELTITGRSGTGTLFLDFNYGSASTESSNFDSSSVSYSITNNIFSPCSSVAGPFEGFNCNAGPVHLGFHFTYDVPFAIDQSVTVRSAISPSTGGYYAYSYFSESSRFNSIVDDAAPAGTPEPASFALALIAVIAFIASRASVPTRD